MKVYSFEPFGYEGTVVTVEADLRRGIPAVDIVGLSDEKVGETCVCCGKPAAKMVYWGRAY